MPYDRFVKFFLPIIPRSVTPNQLTFVRLLFAPVLIVGLVLEEYQVCLTLFVILALTDIFDGSLARLRNQETDWGKIWDPIADKLLIGSVLVVLLLKINIGLTIFILAFEAAFIIGGTVKKITAQNIRLQANTWGKIKMNIQGLGAGLLILGFFAGFGQLVDFAQIILYISLFFAAMSLMRQGI